MSASAVTTLFVDSSASGVSPDGSQSNPYVNFLQAFARMQHDATLLVPVNYFTVIVLPGTYTFGIDIPTSYPALNSPSVHIRILGPRSQTAAYLSDKIYDSAVDAKLSVDNSNVFIVGATHLEIAGFYVAPQTINSGINKSMITVYDVPADGDVVASSGFTRTVRIKNCSFWVPTSAASFQAKVTSPYFVHSGEGVEDLPCGWAITRVGTMATSTSHLVVQGCLFETGEIGNQQFPATTNYDPYVSSAIVVNAYNHEQATLWTRPTAGGYSSCFSNCLFAGVGRVLLYNHAFGVQFSTSLWLQVLGPAIDAGREDGTVDLHIIDCTFENIFGTAIAAKGYNSNALKTVVEYNKFSNVLGSTFQAGSALLTEQAEYINQVYLNMPIPAGSPLSSYVLGQGIIFVGSSQIEAHNLEILGAVHAGIYFSDLAGPLLTFMDALRQFDPANDFHIDNRTSSAYFYGDELAGNSFFTTPVATTYGSAHWGLASSPADYPGVRSNGNPGPQPFRLFKSNAVKLVQSALTPNKPTGTFVLRGVDISKLPEGGVVRSGLYFGPPDGTVANFPEYETVNYVPLGGGATTSALFPLTHFQRTVSILITKQAGVVRVRLEVLGHPSLPNQNFISPAGGLTLSGPINGPVTFGLTLEDAGSNNMNVGLSLINSAVGTAGNERVSVKEYPYFLEPGNTEPVIQSNALVLTIEDLGDQWNLVDPATGEGARVYAFCYLSSPYVSKDFLNSGFFTGFEHDEKIFAHVPFFWTVDASDEDVWAADPGEGLFSGAVPAFQVPGGAPATITDSRSPDLPATGNVQDFVSSSNNALAIGNFQFYNITGMLKQDPESVLSANALVTSGALVLDEFNIYNPDDRTGLNYSTLTFGLLQSQIQEDIGDVVTNATINIGQLRVGKTTEQTTGNTTFNDMIGVLYEGPFGPVVELTNVQWVNLAVPNRFQPTNGSIVVISTTTDELKFRAFEVMNPTSIGGLVVSFEKQPPNPWTLWNHVVSSLSPDQANAVINGIMSSVLGPWESSDWLQTLDGQATPFTDRLHFPISLIQLLFSGHALGLGPSGLELLDDNVTYTISGAPKAPDGTSYQVYDETGAVKEDATVTVVSETSSSVTLEVFIPNYLKASVSANGLGLDLSSLYIAAVPQSTTPYVPPNFIKTSGIQVGTETNGWVILTQGGDFVVSPASLDLFGSGTSNGSISSSLLNGKNCHC